MGTVCKETVLLSLFCAIPALSFAQATSQSEAAGVREAIRFERSKDAADARQARTEAKHPTGYAASSANREYATPGNAVPDRGPAGAAGSADRSMSAADQRGTPERGVQDAIRFERQKAAADARQAHIEARSQSVKHQ